MKRLWSALAMALALCMLCASALAADIQLQVEKQDEDEWRGIIQQTVVGDTLYVLANGDSQQTYLFRWTEDMPQAEQIAAGLCYASGYSSMEDLEQNAQYLKENEGREMDTAHGIGAMFAYEGKLCALNPLNGLVFSIEVKDGQAVYTDIATIKDTSLLFHEEDDWRYCITPSGLAVAGDTLVYLAEDWTEQGQDNRLLLIGLKDGEMRRGKSKFVQCVTSYKDGKALLLSRDDENAWDEKTQKVKPFTLSLYDPATDTEEPAGEMDGNVSRAVYSEKLDALVHVENCRIMAKKLSGESVQVGYIPMEYGYQMTVVGNSLVSGDMARSMSYDFRSDVSLTLYGSWLDEGTQAFIRQNPQVPVYTSSQYYDSLEQLSQAMVSGDTTFDLLRMNTTWSSFFILMNKGYCADLSGNETLMAYVNRLYPCFRDAVTKDGRLYAVPLTAWGYDGWFAATGVMEEMGLTYDDLPKSLTELCEFITRWNDEWAEEYPQFQPIEYTENYKQAMFSYMLDAYLGYCTATGQEVRFSSPEFRAMMDAMEAMRVDEVERAATAENEDEVGYRQGLLMPNGGTVGYFDDNQWRVMVPMSLTPDTDFYTGAELEVMFINPRSAHLEEALKLLECQAQAVEQNASYSRVLLADCTDPVPNENYDRIVKNEQEYLRQMEIELEKADDADKKEWQAAIESQKAWMENNLEDMRWSISEEAIRHYVEDIAPHMFVKRPTFRNGNKDNSAPELDTLIERYQAGQMTMEQFIRDADSKIRMMQMEDY